jgi:CBS domain-containing protein
MQIRDVMTRGVTTIPPNATVVEAAEKMKALDVGTLPVFDGERIVGMITDRDITIRATALGLNPQSAHVREVMTPDLIYCTEDQDVHEAARLMEENQVRRLVVLDKNQKLRGIVSLGDLAVETHDEELAGEILEAVSEPSTPQR